MIDKITSIHHFSYDVKPYQFLNLNFYGLISLDNSIDKLCKVLGEEKKDDALKEDFCPYFGVPWEAGLGLAQYLDQLNLNQKNILEIGAGLSLPSFIATKKGAKVLASDFHADVKTFLETNQNLNNIFFDYVQMNWRKDPLPLGKFDLVIGSDILYESAHPDHVSKTLINYLKEDGKIILSDPGRAYIQKFVTSMNQQGFRETMKIINVNTAWTKKDVFVFTFGRENI